MEVITDFADIADLDLPNQIKESLYQQLTMPFDGDEILTKEVWGELSNTLIFIEDETRDTDFTLFNSSHSSLISRTIELPEFVVTLEGDNEYYLLGLSITGDDGSGCYLLASASTKTYPTTTLLKHLVQ